MRKIFGIIFVLIAMMNIVIVYPYWTINAALFKKLKLNNFFDLLSGTTKYTMFGFNIKMNMILAIILSVSIIILLDIGITMIKTKFLKAE